MGSLERMEAEKFTMWGIKEGIFFLISFLQRKGRRKERRKEKKGGKKQKCAVIQKQNKTEKILKRFEAM